ncbi:unnamed protein product [Diatraea saccharalis]|uniref:Carboxylesterase type B domain-containing protein n=1 Tax=Diatraea saccharalis TaxID=40085 RepID=A0A9N9N225_9NEOP|nr:unnamed protein product [Diatraea saccharalis]
MNLLLTLVCVCAAFTISRAQDTKLVQINQGTIVGYKAQDADLFEFYSIPYATAPTGTHKFKAPLEPPKFSEPFLAVDRGIVCPQKPIHVPEGKTIQEDCLIANIFVPDTNVTDLPVMVSIHGGAFQRGFGNSRSLKHLVNSKRIIAVTFNYRLGIHGFLCLGTEDIPGNAGMKDQIALLRWVNENIAFFGGNPNDVTIAGCGAGGVSSDLLQLSKITNGLFTKLISLSGSNVGLFSVQLDPVNYARNQAKLYNFENADDFNALEEFYKTASYELLMSDDQAEHKHSGVVFSPCIELDLGQERFLDANPIDILKSGDYIKYPVLYGFADKEGLFRIEFFDSWKEDMNKNFSEFLPVDLSFKDTEERESVAKEVKEFYFGDQLITDDDVLKYVDYFTDVMFVYGILRSVTLQVEAGNSELYLHEYSVVHEDLPIIPYADNLRGATHCAQLHAAFDEDESSLSNEYRNAKSIMRDIWINFITTGTPTPDESSVIPRWVPANAQRSPYMSFGEEVRLMDSLIPQRAKFWDDLYERYYRNPIPPTEALNNYSIRINLGKMWTCLYLLSVACIVFVCSEKNVERVVRTPQGPVRGYKDSEDDIFVFYGVPYATAPTGPRKFTAPHPPPEWLETFDAVDKGVICPQYKEDWLQDKTMQEDCLIANIYVPNTHKKDLPVVVYVHGGAFQRGHLDRVVPKKLVNSQKIIAVTFNYRLSTHGFLCLGTDDVPGNAGLKDQIALLRWVQNHIASYGGNPNDVTLAGYSAGSSSVHLLTLLPAAKDLFNKVIPESGANISPSAMQLDPLNNAKSYAKSVGFDNVEDFYALENFYKTASYDVLTEKSSFNRTDNTFVFTPCIERNTGPNSVLIDSPYNIMKKGNYNKIPLLYGLTKMEGMFRLPLFETWKDAMNENFADFLPADLTFKTDTEKREVIGRIKQFYFNGKPVTGDNILSYIDYFTDTIFAFPILRAAKLHAEVGHDKVYLYEYDYVDESMPVIPYTNNVRGADHCSQTLAVMDGSGWFNANETNLSKEYLNVKDLLRDIWINFIITGNPVSPKSTLSQWPCVDKSGSPHMSLGSIAELRGPLLQDRMAFWNSIYDKHYRLPFPPPPPPPLPPPPHTEM